MTEHLTDLDAAVDWLFARVDGPLRIGAPLALGKPHRLLNALYARVEHDPSRPLQLYTALSLNPPKARGNGLEARFWHRSRSAISATISAPGLPMRSRAMRCRHMCRWKSSTCSPAPCSVRARRSPAIPA
jgi:hypothetical protein